MPFRLASSNFISGSSVPSMCTCSSHFGMPAMKSRKAVMTILLLSRGYGSQRLQRLRHRVGLAVGQRKLRDMPQTMDEARIGAQGLLPIVAFGQDHAGPDDVGAGRAHQ